MLVPSGAQYLDDAETEVPSSPFLNGDEPRVINTFPYDGEDCVPASDRLGSHPIHLTAWSQIWLHDGDTTVHITVNRFIGTESSIEDKTSVSVEAKTIEVVVQDQIQLSDEAALEGGNVFDITIEDSVEVAERIETGLDNPVFDGTTFTPPFAASSTYAEVASDGGGTNDEHRFVIIRDYPFKSLEVVTVDVHVEGEEPA